jgi:hypothetical protein
MTKVQYYTAASLDGFIADQHNSLAWLYAVPHDDGDSTWDDFIAGVGPMVRARRPISGRSTATTT